MVPLGTDMHPVTLTEMTVRGTSAVHQVFSLSREGKDYKACRFSNTCCAEMRLVL